jgi:TetR/AcrR family transcriptional repressor of nem operon
MGAKEKILTEATKLIHSKGFNNTSIQDILDAASVTKSNFYYHFESKDRLGFDVITHRMRQFNELIIEPSLGDSGLGAIERLDRFLDKMLAIASKPEGELGCPFGNLAQEMSTIHEPLRKSLSEFFVAYALRLEECFEDGKKLGEFRPELPSRALAEFMLAQMQGSFLLRKTHKDVGIMKSNIELLRQNIHAWARPVAQPA